MTSKLLIVFKSVQKFYCKSMPYKGKLKNSYLFCVLETVV